MSTDTTRTGQPAYRHLLDKVANDLIRNLKLKADDLLGECTFQESQEQDGKNVLVPVTKVVLKNEGWEGEVEQAALAEAMKMQAETLARIIVAEPNAALYNVHCGTWLGKQQAGPYLLQQIAATAIVCRIRDLLGVGYGTHQYLPHQTSPVAA